MIGKIKWFSFQRRYGFCLGEDGKDYFCHANEQADSEEQLAEGDSISFNVESTEKGLKATNCFPISP